MQPRELAAIRDAVRGRLAEDAPMAPLSTYRVGGPAAVLVEPADTDDLAALLPRCAELGVPVLVVGGGSNLLVSDAGYPGVVVRLRASPFNGIDVIGEGAGGPRLRLGGGVRVTRLMGRAGQAGWGALTFLEGIPGTVGGCVRMNAGTRDGEMKDVVVDVECVTADGARTRLPGARCGFAYRRSALPPGSVVTAATVDAGRGEPAEVKAALRAHHDYRRRTQPLGHSGGSVFKNPPGDSAGRLIEAAGLKGTRLGGAWVSELHANFIRTEPGATAADVLALMLRCQQAVSDRFGVALERENVCVGFGP